jgi:hypothetical protein
MTNAFRGWALPVLGCILCSGALAAAPVIALPDSAMAYGVGERIVLNGMPMDLRGFTSTSPIEETAAWFRRSLGAPVVENRIGDALVLGKASGDYYLTVQLRATAAGTSGVTAVADLKTAAADIGRRRAWAAVDALVPEGSRILSDMTSEDRGRRSRDLVFSNDMSERANSARLQTVLTARGFVFEREGVAAAPVPPGSLRPGRTLYFTGREKEALATIAEAEQGRTVVVVNTVTSLENYR